MPTPATVPKRKPADGQSRALPSLIAAYLELTEHAPAPDVFRLWSGIFMVQAALTRRVWIETKANLIYPGPFFVLCAESGIGKSPALDDAMKILWELDYSDNVALAGRGVRMGPERVTASSVFTFLASENSQRVLDYAGLKVPFRNMVCVAEEAGTLFPELSNPFGGMELGARVIKVLDAADRDTRSLASDEVDMMMTKNLSGAFLVGVQTATLMRYFPPDSWSQGLAARCVFLYSNESKGVDLFHPEGEGAAIAAEKNSLREEIISDLRQVSDLSGPFLVERPAMEALNGWWQQGKTTDGPKHPMLATYCRKRVKIVPRLCMTISAARSNEMIITKDDVEVALDLLRSAETVMENMFEHTVSADSDEGIMMEVAHTVRAFHEAKSGAAVPEQQLKAVIGKKTKSHMVEPLIKHMLERGLIERTYLAIPLPGGKKAVAYVPGRGGGG